MLPVLCLVVSWYSRYTLLPYVWNDGDWNIYSSRNFTSNVLPVSRTARWIKLYNQLIDTNMNVNYFPSLKDINYYWCMSHLCARSKIFPLYRWVWTSLTIFTLIITVLYTTPNNPIAFFSRKTKSIALFNVSYTMLVGLCYCSASHFFGGRNTSDFK